MRKFIKTNRVYGSALPSKNRGRKK